MSLDEKLVRSAGKAEKVTREDLEDSELNSPPYDKENLVPEKPVSPPNTKLKISK